MLALHPKTGELRTAKILTAAMSQTDQIQDLPIQYRAQFDRSALGVPLIKDQDLVPINIQGANWELFRNKFDKDKNSKSNLGPNEGASKDNKDEASNNGLTLANEIRNQMLYYKVLRDKHDNSLINTLQDLNTLL